MGFWQGNVSPHSLRMLEGAFLLHAAQILNVL